MRKINPTLIALCAILLWLGTAQAQRYVDNGDGTISDTTSGLMWEKKTEVVGIHNLRNTYTWGHVGDTRPDGTAFTDFLGTLNDGLSTNGTTITHCFANHCDWRLPTFDELFSLPSLEPIDPIFGPTEPGFYLSSTTTDGAGHNGGQVWGVGFAQRRSSLPGGFGLTRKDAFEYVRAVRGPSCGDHLCTAGGL